ncbi:serine/threonine-protein kinase pakA-like isoform X1 [Chelonus insularis]|uniref:serine/threonine-protein kinase pakA-like isoform X1 n=1 Tax=Chelonus insularis TaxID=460826 RepID=UPI00158C0A6D|nr:serine/threonine-protein kinase pakA-like isoform X1 [Chelonus insularis]XP_034939448.1 serine/threonine-protein kinase pakA-like isoform X1 [Chelonus insularis]
MSYYGDGISYYYGAGPFANHSSLMTGTTRIHTPLRFAPHLSTISESSLSTYRRYSPNVLPYRPRKIIDTADIDVSTPRPLHSNHQPHGNRLRRDRPTIRIRSQALKDNPALRDHVERREKTAGELLVEKFLIRDKKASLDDIRMKMYRQVSLESNKNEQEAIKRRITRKFTRRRSSADVQIDPEQLKREIEIAQVQAKVLDSLVAEEQAEIEVETRKGTLIHKNAVRTHPPILKKTTSESDDTDSTETKKKIQKKTKKRKKTTDKPSPPQEVPSEIEESETDSKVFKVEASNSVDDLSTLVVNARDKKIEQFKESIKLPAPKSFFKKNHQDIEEEVVILPAKKPYVHDQSRNSVYLTLKTSNLELKGNDQQQNVNNIQADQSIDDEESKVAKIGSKDIIESDVEVNDGRGLKDQGKSWVEGEGWMPEAAEKINRVSEHDKDLISGSEKIVESSKGIDNSQRVKELQKDLKKTHTKTLCEISEFPSREVSQEDFKGTHDRTWNDKLSSLTKNLAKDSTPSEKKKEKRLKENDECLVDVNSVKTQESQQQDDEKSKSLPNSTVINLETNRNEQNESRINESKFLSESKASIQEIIEPSTTTGREAEKTTLTVIQNKTKLIDVIDNENNHKSPEQNNLSGILNNSLKGEIKVQEEVKKVPKKVNKQKNAQKTPKLKEDVSQESNDSVNDKNINLKVKALKGLKKILKHSKGTSFECDQNSELKETDTCNLENDDESKSPVQNKPKSKLISKSISFEDEKDQSKVVNTKKDSILGEINSAEPIINEIIPKDLYSKSKTNISKSPVSSFDSEEIKSPISLPLVQEEKQLELLGDKQTQESSQEIDFWSEIKPEDDLKVKKPKPVSNISTTKSTSESTPTSPEIEKVKLEKPVVVESSNKVPVKAKKKKCSENSMEKEKKKHTNIIFDTAVNPLEDEQKHLVDVKSSENSESIKKSSKKPDEVTEKLNTLKPHLKIEINNKIKSSNSIIKNSENLEIDKLIISPQITSDKLENIEQISENKEINVNSLKSDASSEVEIPVVVIDTLDIPRTIIEAVTEEEEENDDDEDECPITPINEEEKVLSSNMSKWNGSSNLTELNEKEVASTTVETGNEVVGSTNASVQSSGKKKLGRKKKSISVSPETTVIRKNPEEKAVSKNSISSDATVKAKAYKNSPKAQLAPAVIPNNRPIDLVKMFYTTPSSLLTATPRDLSKVKRAKIKRRKHSTPSASSDSTGSSRSTGRAESTQSNSTVEDEAEQKRISSTRSNDSGFDGSPRLSTPSQSSDNQRNSDSSDHLHSSGRITPPATNLPRFKKYAVEDFNFLKVLGKGSFGKVLLAELRGTDCVYAVKCLKKDVVLEDDDVECTLIERKVLTLATRHPYLCHLFCTFQTDSHLFFVMEYLNGGDLMFHIQKSGRFPEFRAKFYAAEIWSGLNFLHKKGIVYRDLKLDNVLLDFEGHIRIADFGMCKLQIFLDRTADTFCGTPDYMAPEIIKGLKYNQSVDWWSFGVLLYEMLTGQSPFSGCDEDELFWSICNERPFIPRYLTQESMDILIYLLEKDAGKRPLGHEVQAHSFFHNINWDRLERRLLEPPFKPTLDHTLDTKYFDTAFTAERPRLTPVPEQILSSMDQGVFRGFSYTNPNATD